LSFLLNKKSIKYKLKIKISKYEPGCLKNLSSLKLKMTLINTMIVLKIQT